MRAALWIASVPGDGPGPTWVDQTRRAVTASERIGGDANNHVARFGQASCTTAIVAVSGIPDTAPLPAMDLTRRERDTTAAPREGASVTVPGLGPLESAIMTVIWDARQPVPCQNSRISSDLVFCVISRLPFRIR